MTSEFPESQVIFPFSFSFFFFCPLNAAHMLRKAVAGLLKLDMIIVDAG